MHPESLSMPHATTPEKNLADATCARVGTIGSRERREVEQGERLYGAGPATPKTRKGRPQPTMLAAQASSADNPNDPNYKGKTPPRRRRSQGGRTAPNSLNTEAAAGSAHSSRDWDDLPPSPLTEPESEAEATPPEAAPQIPVNAIAPRSDSRRSLFVQTTALLSAMLAWASRQRPSFWQVVIMKILAFISLVYATIVLFNWVTSTQLYMAVCADTRERAAELRPLKRPIKKFGADATSGALSLLGLMELAVKNLPLLLVMAFILFCSWPMYRRLLSK